jgi:hypothetical protein
VGPASYTPCGEGGGGEGREGEEEGRGRGGVRCDAVRCDAAASFRHLFSGVALPRATAPPLAAGHARTQVTNVSINDTPWFRFQLDLPPRSASTKRPFLVQV